MFFRAWPPEKIREKFIALFIFGVNKFFPVFHFDKGLENLSSSNRPGIRKKRSSSENNRALLLAAAVIKSFGDFFRVRGNAGGISFAGFCMIFFGLKFCHLRVNIFLRPVNNLPEINQQ